jgi:hypothetical protein
VFGQIVADHVGRIRLLNDFSGAVGLEGATRMHGNRGGTTLNPLCEGFGVVPLILASQHCPEVLDAFAMLRLGWLEGGPTQLAAGRQLHAVRGETVLNQFHPYLLGRLKVWKHGEYHSAHVRLLTSVEGVTASISS